MLQIDQTVMYGTIGLCKIATILPGEKSYLLEPFLQKGGQLVASFEQETVVRELMTQEEILTVIEEVRSLDKNWYANPELREHEYRQAERGCEFRRWLKLSLDIRHAKQRSKHENISLTPADSKAQRTFERLMGEEYSFVFGLEFSEAKKELRKRIKGK